MHRYSSFDYIQELFFDEFMFFIQAMNDRREEESFREATNAGRYNKSFKKFKKEMEIQRKYSAAGVDAEEKDRLDRLNKL